MVDKTTQMQLIEALDPEGRDIVTIIRDAYARGGNLRRAAALMGIDNSVLCRWMERLGLRIRGEIVSIEDAEPPADLAGVAK